MVLLATKFENIYEGIHNCITELQIQGTLKKMSEFIKLLWWSVDLT